VFVVEVDGGRLVGMTGIYVPPNRPKLAHGATIWGVYVRPEARGRGVGQQLIRACIDWARGKGLVIVKLSATIAQDAAPRRCYEACGFEAYGVDPMAVQVDGQFYDEVLMACRL
jgi:GNAT superfamily N-acetyltransferase